MNNEIKTPIHAGSIIRAVMDKRRTRKNALAREMGKRTGNSILQYTKSAALLTSSLIAISHAMKHNFFADIAAMLPAHYSSNAPTDNTNANRISALEKENELLLERVKVLMEIRK